MANDGLGQFARGTLDVATDPTYSSLKLTGSSMAEQRRSLLLEQLGAGGVSATVTITIPGTGSRGEVFVGDWTALGQSLVFEIVTAPNGHVTGLLLQESTAERGQLTSRLMDDLQGEVAQVADAGLRNSLQAKLDNASKQIAAGNTATAANVIEALDNAVAAHEGAGIPSDLASALHASARELIGLLRAPLD